MGPMTRQEMQNILEQSRNQLVQRVPTKQDFILLSDVLKTLLNIMQQNQQLIHQAEYQRAQAMRHVVALEARLAQLEQEVKGYKDAFVRISADIATLPQVLLSVAVSGNQKGQAGNPAYPNV